MKVLSTLLAISSITASTAFVLQPAAVSSSTSVQMGLMDFFSPDAKQAREEKRRREIEEQERLQKVIMERRKNPEKMEEYESKVALRRQLIMEGNDEAASEVKIYENVEEQTLLDGTKGQQA